MKKITKSHTEGDSTSFDDLPDDIIVLQVKAISFTSVTHPLVDPRDMKLNISISVTLSRSFESVMLSLKKFTKVKSVRIQLSCPYDNPLLFKWKIKFGNKIDSFLFLSPNSIFHNQNVHVKENSHKEDMEMKNNIALVCKRRMISYSVGKFTQMRSYLTSPYETIKQKLSNGENVLRKVDQCYVPLLKLPISRYVMKGVTLILRERISLPDDIRVLNTHMLDDEF
ncbi:hypothetical protein Tco_0803282 [Tanacetum coccineum]|uniref:Uncharacterized protein n=1 Tax=Tanacetum coccineum TaxID=301880 RepID=A0ABQ5A179_9ASTR